MFWWTGCVGCGPICGGRRRRSEPERAGGEQAGALGLACFDGGGSLERRRSRQSALRQVPWPLGCRATGRALSASFCVVAVPPTSPAHGRTVRKPTPATAAAYSASGAVPVAVSLNTSASTSSQIPGSPVSFAWSTNSRSRRSRSSRSVRRSSGSSSARRWYSADASA